jgi:glyoxylase-like metal-dependent hydrolase (beta-lactamase superfamily II)
VLSIVRVLAPNPDVLTLDGTNTWIVGNGPTIVVDPGPDLRGHLDEVARSAGRIAAVLVTHDHPDHAPSASSFAGEVDAPLFAFRLDGARRLRDGQVFPAGGGELRAVLTPGHTSDHVAFFEPSARALFTGDAVLGRGTSFIDPPEGDLGRYLTSLRRMLELGPRTIYPGHGPIVLDATGKIREYLSHRQERENQIVQALAAGPRTVDDLVRQIYVDYPPDVRPLAARSVLAHLLKLETEGRTTKDGRGDDARWSAATPRACTRCGRPFAGRARYCSSCSLILLQEGGDEPHTASESKT